MDRRGGRNAARNRESLLGLFISSIFLTRALFFFLSRPIDRAILPFVCIETLSNVVTNFLQSSSANILTKYTLLETIRTTFSV